MYVIVMETIKGLHKQQDESLHSDSVEAIWKEILVDFLFRFKDKHPFSNPEEFKIMDIHNKIMDFIEENGLEPSDTLKDEYSQSEFTKKLNQLPTCQYLEKKFKRKMKKSSYEKLKKRYESKAPYIYYFNPSIPIEEKIGEDQLGYYIEIRFFSKDRVRTYLIYHIISINKNS